MSQSRASNKPVRRVLWLRPSDAEGFGGNLAASIQIRAKRQKCRPNPQRQECRCYGSRGHGASSSRWSLALRLLWLCWLLLGGLALPLAAQQEWQSGPFIYTSDGASATLTGYTGEGVVVAIPATIGGLPMRTIKGFAIYNRTSITSVIIPEGVISIGNGAFANHTGLTSVAIPASVISIGSNAFAGCVSLSRVTIPAGVTSIGNRAFAGCTGLISVAIPASVTSIGSNSFYFCTGLLEIEVAAGNPAYRSVDGVLFNAALTALMQYPVGKKSEAYAIPGSVISIEWAAFGGCASLTHVAIPDSVTYIRGEAFVNCTGLTSVIIPEGVTFIENGAFAGCTGLTSVAIPDGVTSIGDSAFSNCTGLTGVTIGNNVTSIGHMAFFGCTGLTSVTIPDGVTHIGWNAFAGCLGLIRASFAGGTPSLDSNVFYNVAPTFSIIYYEGRAGFTSPTWRGYQAASVPQPREGDFLYHSDGSAIILTGYLGAGGAATIPDTIAGLPVRTMGINAFQGKTSVTRVAIPDSVISIKRGAFAGCTSLAGLAVGTGVATIGERVFESCASLLRIDVAAANPAYRSADGVLFNKAGTTLVQYPEGRAGSYAIPGGVTSIRDSAFANCVSLTSVTIPEGVIFIEDYTFYNCRSLASVMISEGVTSIGNYAFGGCVSLTSVVIPEGVTSLGGYAFSGCAGLASVSLPTSLKSIGYEAFGSCSSLASVAIPESVTTLDTSAFSGCVSLTSVVITGRVAFIGSGAFADCTSLASVTISEGVAYIGNYAFSGCASLVSLTFPDSVTSIGWEAFQFCTSLTDVTIGAGVIDIGWDAFFNCTSLLEIEVAAANPAFRSLDGVLFNKAGTTLLQYPGGRAGDYAVPGEVTAIGPSAFRSCASLTRLTLGAGVATIGVWAFADCASLLEIEVADDNPAFRSTDGVLFDKAGTTLLQYPGGRAGHYVVSGEVTAIGDYAFAQCAGLTGVFLPDSVKTIGEAAFEDCVSLVSAFFDGHAPRLGDDVFSNVAPGFRAFYYEGNAGFTPGLRDEDDDGYVEYPTAALPRQLQAHSLVRHGNAATLVATGGRQGRTYELQCCPALSAPWVTIVNTGPLAASRTLQLTDHAPSPGQAFYRVVEIAP